MTVVMLLLLLLLLLLMLLMMMMIIPSRFILARMVTAWKLFSFLFEQGDSRQDYQSRS